MSTNEEELQKKIEMNPSVDSDDIDAKSYQLVFRALKKEPSAELSRNFEERIIQLVLEKRRREARRDSFGFGFGIFMMLITLIVAIAFTGFSLELGFLKAMSDYKGLVVFGIAFVIFLNWLDKKLIRRHTV